MTAAANGHRTIDPWLYPREETRNKQLDAQTAALEMRTLLAKSTGHVYSDEELAEAADARPLARNGEAVAFEEAMLKASHRLFENSGRQEDRTRLFLEKLLAVAGWGGDVEGFLQDWRVRHIAPHQDSGMVADVIELQHEGKKEDYIVRYITDRYEPDDD